MCVYFRNFRRLYFNDFSSDLVVLYVHSYVSLRSHLIVWQTHRRTDGRTNCGANGCQNTIITITYTHTHTVSHIFTHTLTQYYYSYHYVIIIAIFLYAISLFTWYSFRGPWFFGNKNNKNITVLTLFTAKKASCLH